MPKVSYDWSKVIFYKIVCNDLQIKNCYVGQTQNFIKRKCYHKEACISDKCNRHNLKVYEFIRQNGGWINWTMIMVEQFSCNNRLEADSRERYWIETLNANLNSRMPSRTRKEREPTYQASRNKEQKRIYNNTIKYPREKLKKLYLDELLYFNC